jgi:methylated-DNA-[protein]-cysteine S-methyltransferase
VIRYATLETPLGPMPCARDDIGITHLRLPEHRRGSRPADDWVRDDDAFDDVRTQLGEYFFGRRTVFDLPLHAAGNPWQHRVWAALTEIPWGTTTTYGALAAQLGVPKAARAVGTANALNPVPIIVPCHRVIGANGALTGYAGGLDTKRRLLELEGAQAGLFAV